MEIKQEIAQVQKRPETFADIRKETEARFRELVEAWMQRRSTFQTTLGAMQAFNNVFDRLDAAHKREKAEWVNANAGLAKLVDIEKAGDCTKLREALVSAIGTLKKLYAPSKRTAGHIVTCRQKCEAALAEPARNCDRFTTETDAQIAFLREVWLIGVSNLDRDPFDGWTNEMKSAYSKWLFAPAPEKEGGAK